MSSGSEGLVHLGVRLGGCGVMLQAASGQGLSLDTLAFGPDGLAAAEVDAGRGEIAQALVWAGMVVSRKQREKRIWQYTT